MVVFTRDGDDLKNDLALDGDDAGRFRFGLHWPATGGFGCGCYDYSLSSQLWNS
jgi:hypothetical protein